MGEGGVEGGGRKCNIPRHIHSVFLTRGKDKGIFFFNNLFQGRYRKHKVTRERKIDGRRIKREDRNDNSSSGSGKSEKGRGKGRQGKRNKKGAPGKEGKGRTPGKEGKQPKFR